MTDCPFVEEGIVAVCAPNERLVKIEADSEHTRKTVDRLENQIDRFLEVQRTAEDRLLILEQSDKAQWSKLDSVSECLDSFNDWIRSDEGPMGIMVVMSARVTELEDRERKNRFLGIGGGAIVAAFVELCSYVRGIFTP